MADDQHVFVASGDSCANCSSLNGQVVPAGYTAHDNCRCQTVPRKDGDEGCHWDFVQSGNARDGNNPYDVVSGIEVTVECPDGSVVGAERGFDGHSFNNIADPDAAFDAWLEGLEDAAEELAQELCDSCPEKEPFLCC